MCHQSTRLLGHRFLVSLSPCCVTLDKYFTSLSFSLYWCHTSHSPFNDNYILGSWNSPCRYLGAGPGLGHESQWSLKHILICCDISMSSISVGM